MVNYGMERKLPMSALRTRGRIGDDGVLTVKLPAGSGKGVVDVVLEWPLRPSMTNDEFKRLLDETYGIMPDIERADQGRQARANDWSV